MTIVCMEPNVKVIGQGQVMGQANAVNPTSIRGSFFLVGYSIKLAISDFT